MAEIPIGPGGPEEEELPQVEMEIASPEEFAGGVDITEDGKGGAILEALKGGEGMEVETEVYDHNANLAEVLDDGILGEMSSDLVAQYEEDKVPRSRSGANIPPRFQGRANRGELPVELASLILDVESGY